MGASLVIERRYSPLHGDGWRARVRPLNGGRTACRIWTLDQDNKRDADYRYYTVFPTLAECVEWLADDCT